MSDLFASIAVDFEQADWLIRLICAVIAGSILGLDRKLRHRRVGIRTYMMVALGAAIFTLVSIEMSIDMDARGLAADPTRVIQGLIGGLGFLGAGAIIQGEKRVGGMVTAASLWLSGALGLAAGLGYGLFAIICAVLAALVMASSRFLSDRGSEDRPDIE
ncbi:MgtC/SapB family protein [Tateyamaria sp. SN6-1]|uniref:MgtC/SapB family protein n=1 Tax=Tateyamaria sp. SN6-1 TaxID=3092148 RepID=UPI0039F57FAA